MPLWVLSAERIYLAVRKEYFLENMKRWPEAVLDCFVGSRRRDELSLKILE